MILHESCHFPEPFAVISLYALYINWVCVLLVHDYQWLYPFRPNPTEEFLMEVLVSNV